MTDAKLAKGTSISVTLDLVRERGGEEAIHELAARLPTEVRDAIGREMRPLATSLYPFDVWIEVLLAAEALFGEAFIRESSRHGYAKLFAGTYRSSVVAGDPTATLARLPRLWAQLTDGIGTIEVEPSGLGVHVELAIPDRYKRLAYERVAGLVEALVAATGCEVVARVSAKGRGVEIRVEVHA